MLTGAERKEGDEGDGVGTQSPVECARVGVLDICHCRLLVCGYCVGRIDVNLSIDALACCLGKTRASCTTCGHEAEVVVIYSEVRKVPALLR